MKLKRRWWKWTLLRRRQRGTGGDRAMFDDDAVVVALAVPVLLRCPDVASMLAHRRLCAAGRIGYLIEPEIWLRLVGKVGWESDRCKRSEPCYS